MKIIQVAFIFKKKYSVNNISFINKLIVEDGLTEKEFNAYFVRRFCENNPGSIYKHVDWQ